MSPDLCRLCSTDEKLSNIFIKKHCADKYSAVLYSTTGLKIACEDGLPQKICESCKYLVDSSLKLLNQSRSAEMNFIKLGYKLIENHISYKEIDISDIQKFNDINEMNDDHENITGLADFTVHVECDRLSQNEESDESENVTINKINFKNNNRKAKRQMYLDLVDGILDPKGPVKCKICKKSVSKWTCFISHAKLHVGFKFMCEFCGKSFISSTQLKRHCRSHHGMKRELPCTHCSYLALDKAQLILHERRLHTGERPYICDICGASYFSRRCLVQHIEGHRDIANVQCPQCPALLKSKRHLARHMYSTHRSRCKTKTKSVF